MKTRDMLRLAVKLLREKAKEQPKRRFINSSGQKAEIGEIADHISNLASWVYPDLSTEDITKVVRCKNCKYYTEYRSKATYQHTTYMACSQTGVEHPPEYFCADGLERIDRHG